MSRFKCLAMGVFLLANASVSHSQSVEDYDARLLKLRVAIPLWQGEIDAIDPAKIVVPYHIGKLIDDNKTVLRQDLALALLYSARIRAQHHLAAEIELYGVLRDIHVNMDTLSDILINMVSSEQKVAQSWAQELSEITNGPLNNEEQYQAGALDTFADALERRCAVPSPNNEVRAVQADFSQQRGYHEDWDRLTSRANRTFLIATGSMDTPGGSAFCATRKHREDRE